MPFANAAVDVDRPDDLPLAEAILSRRSGMATLRPQSQAAAS